MSVSQSINQSNQHTNQLKPLFWPSIFLLQLFAFHLFLNCHRWPKSQPFRNNSTSTKAWRLAWKVGEEEEEKWTKRLRGNIRSKDHLHPPSWDATTPTTSPIPVTTPTKWLPRTAQSWMGMMNGETVFKDCSIGVWGSQQQIYQTISWRCHCQWWRYVLTPLLVYRWYYKITDLQVSWCTEVSNPNLSK